MKWFSFGRRRQKGEKVDHSLDTLIGQTAAFSFAAATRNTSTMMFRPVTPSPAPNDILIPDRPLSYQLMDFVTSQAQDYISRDKLISMVNLLQSIIHPFDVILLILLGWAFVPLVSVLYEVSYLVPKCYYSQPVEILDNATSIVHRRPFSKNPCNDKSFPFRDTFLFQLADHTSQAARVALVVYAVDCIMTVLIQAQLCRPVQFSSLCSPHVASTELAKILYLLWSAQRVSVFKRFVITQRLRGQPKSPGRIAVYDRLGNGIITAVTLLCVCSLLDVHMGWSITTSVFAFGSISTVVFGLASRDLASMFVSGIALSLTDRIRVGDEVYFGDGTCGIVQELGWTRTIIRQFDEIIADIPNSQLGMQRVKNVSRCYKCRVKQQLRFRYQDAEIIPRVLDEILLEVKASCSEVICDGSRPFRAFLVNYGDTHIEAFLDVHFHLRPSGHKYWANRHEVLLAIHRVVVQRNQLEFVMTPSMHKFNK